VTPRRERVPIAAAIVAAVGAALFILPLLGLLWTAPWADLGHALFEPAALMAMRLSLVCSLAATAVSIVLGLPLAWIQARTSFPGRSLVRALTLLPVVLPPVVGGVALLSVFGRRGLLGQFLDPLGIRLPFTTAGTVLAQTFVAMPFFVLSMEGVLRTLDRGLEDAARTLGANRWTVFRRITVPLVRPSVAAGAALCWARALGEFGATITFAGNLSGTTQTLPLYAYGLLESGDVDGAVGMSLVLVVVALGVLLLLRDRWLRPGGIGAGLA
jgi:molybdate transport system permease protein